MNSRLKVKFRWSAVEFHGWPLKCENIESHADLASSDCRDKNVVKNGWFTKKWTSETWNLKFEIGNWNSPFRTPKLEHESILTSISLSLLRRPLYQRFQLGQLVDLRLQTDPQVLMPVFFTQNFAFLLLIITGFRLSFFPSNNHLKLLLLSRDFVIARAANFWIFKFLN